MPEPQKPKRRSYSDREKAQALALYDASGNLTETAKACGIPDSTLHQWINGKAGGAAPEVSLMRSGVQLSPLDLAQSFETIAGLATSEVSSRLSDPKQVKEISLPHLLRASEVGVEKSQLLRGQPTAIQGVIERQELVVILQSALTAGLSETVIDAD